MTNLKVNENYNNRNRRGKMIVNKSNRFRAGKSKINDTIKLCNFVHVSGVKCTFNSDSKSRFCREHSIVLSLLHLVKKKFSHSITKQPEPIDQNVTQLELTDPKLEKSKICEEIKTWDEEINAKISELTKISNKITDLSLHRNSLTKRISEIDQKIDDSWNKSFSNLIKEQENLRESHITAMLERTPTPSPLPTPSPPVEIIEKVSSLTMDFDHVFAVKGTKIHVSHPETNEKVNEIVNISNGTINFITSVTVKGRSMVITGDSDNVLSFYDFNKSHLIAMRRMNAVPLCATRHLDALFVGQVDGSISEVSLITFGDRGFFLGQGDEQIMCLSTTTGVKNSSYILISATSSTKLHLYWISNRRHVITVMGIDTSPIISMLVVNNRIITGTESGFMCCHDFESTTKISTVRMLKHPKSITSIHTLSNVVITTCSDSFIRTFSQNGELMNAYQIQNIPILCGYPLTRKLLCGLEDGSVICAPIFDENCWVKIIWRQSYYSFLNKYLLESHINKHFTLDDKKTCGFSNCKYIAKNTDDLIQHLYSHSK